MNTIAKKIGIALLSAATMFAPLSTTTAYAESGNVLSERRLENNNKIIYHRHKGHNRHNSFKHRYGQRIYRGNRGHRIHRKNRDAVALGIIGLGVGAIIGGAIANSHNRPAVRHRPSTRTVHGGGRLEPWSPSWFRYCSNRFRSFNASTGTYRGYDGRDHFCVAR